MTTDIQHIDVDSDEFENAPKALRDYAKKLQKTNGELTQTITEFRSEKVDGALTDVLAGFKNPGRVKSALLADSVDPLDSGAVAKWVETNGDDYAKGEAPAAAAAATKQVVVDPYAQLNNIGQIATPATADKWEVVKGLITKEMTPADLAELFKAHGI